MSRDAMPKPGDVIVEKYVVDSVLGEGGMGAVFAATHKITGKRVALKWMHTELAQDQEASQRFIREAQAAGRIDHPNVVDVYDVGQQGDTVFLVMEYLYGEPLTALLARGPVEPTEAVRLLMPALRGVAAAHRQGVVHRDIKPDNIFLCRSPEGKPREAKVLDFGISKVSSKEGQLSPRLTRTGAVMGTPYYMSPEQVRGSKEVGPQADVYAFGVILYEALTGQVPFNAETFSALVLEIATGTPTPVRELRSELSPALEAVVMKAMGRESEDRYPDIASFAHALEPFCPGVAFDAERADPTGSSRLAMAQPPQLQSAATATSTPFTSEAPVKIPVKKGLPLMVAGGLAAVVLLAGAGVWTLIREPSDPAQDANQIRPAAAPPLQTPSAEQIKPAVNELTAKPAAREQEPASGAHPVKGGAEAKKSEQAVDDKAEEKKAAAEKKAEEKKAAAEKKAEAEAKKQLQQARRDAERARRAEARKARSRSARASSRQQTASGTRTTSKPGSAAKAGPASQPSKPAAPRRPARRSRSGGLNLDDF